MSDLTEVYRKLSRLHSKLEQHNKGDDYYHQFYTLRHINGDGCPMLPLISKNLPIDFIEKELKELVTAYRDYKATGGKDPNG